MQLSSVLFHAGTLSRERRSPALRKIVSVACRQVVRATALLALALAARGQDVVADPAAGGHTVAPDAPPRSGAPAKPTATATSSQPGNGPELAVDGNPKTLWHSATRPRAPLPQAITLDLGEVKPVAALTYLPREGAWLGTVVTYAVAVSIDGEQWTRVVEQGHWPCTARRKHANFAPTSARYVRLEVLAGSGGYASAAEVGVSDKPIPDEPTAPPAGRVTVTAPAHCSDIAGDTVIAFAAPGIERVTATSWKQGDGFGADAVIGAATPDADGKGSIVFKADEFPHGPICVILTGAIAGAKDKEGKPVVDRCCLQLFNRGGVKWQQGLPKPPPAAEGMTVIFADDFDRMPSIGSADPTATYYDHKPPDGSQDFSSLPFTGRGEPGDPFFQMDGWLRIRADEATGSSGLIASLKRDGAGILASAPCYFECRFIGANAPGSWPAFWLLSDYHGEPVAGKKEGPCDELDIIEAYGGEGEGSPSAFDKYCVTPHAWDQDQAAEEARRAAMKSIRAGKGSAGMDHAPQVVSMRNVGIPSTWYQAPHIYACKITETDTIYYCDDLEIARHPTLPISKRAPFYFLINMATGGGWPVDLSRCGGKADMWVDYVRVFSANPKDVEKARK